MGSGIRLADRSLTLRLRRDAFLRDADRQSVADAAKALLADAFRWTRDEALMRDLCGLLGLDSVTPADAVFKVKRAIETGELVAIPDPPRYTGAGSSGSGNPKPASITFTPSQLFKGASRIARPALRYASPARITMPSNDWLAKWEANPGDILPDGSIATALNSSRDNPDATAAGAGDDIAAFAGDIGEATTLGDARPFEYVEEGSVGDDMQTGWMPIDGGPRDAWVVNPSGSGQLRYFDGNGNAAIDIDCDRDHGFGSPHYHLWTDGVRDKGNAMSTITY